MYDQNILHELVLKYELRFRLTFLFAINIEAIVKNMLFKDDKNYHLIKAGKQKICFCAI